MIIESGIGNSKSAGVDSNNRLGTNAITHSGATQASIKGKGFLVNNDATANTLTVTATGGYILTLENDSSTDTLFIDAVFASTDAAGTVMQFDRNPTIGTLGNNNSITPANLDFRSGSSGNATCNIWDEVGNGITGITAGTIINSFILGQGVNIIPVDETFILGKDDVFGILLNSTTTTDECALGVRFHFIANEEVANLA